MADLGQPHAPADDGRLVMIRRVTGRGLRTRKGLLAMLGIEVTGRFRSMICKHFLYHNVVPVNDTGGILDP